jgi:hypothetical protein
MKRPIECSKCGEHIIKMYGYKDLCNLCHTKRLNLSAIGSAELKKLKGELNEVKAKLRSLRTTLANTKLSLKTSVRKYENLKADYYNKDKS